MVATGDLPNAGVMREPTETSEKRRQTGEAVPLDLGRGWDEPRIVGPKSMLPVDAWPQRRFGPVGTIERASRKAGR
jgi:hypothetical protein